MFFSNFNAFVVETTIVKDVTEKRPYRVRSACEKTVLTSINWSKDQVSCSVNRFPFFWLYETPTPGALRIIAI